MVNTRQGIKNYARFISKVCLDENLLPLDRPAMAVVVEEGLRITGRKKQLSTRFSDIADIVRESHFWAKQKNGKIIQKKHVSPRTYFCGARFQPAQVQVVFPEHAQ